MASPILGLTELAQAQAIPETTVNENTRWLEFFAAGGAIVDRDLATPPGSPADGDAYLVDASATGAWAGQDGAIALYINTAWAFKPAAEGMQLFVKDEDVRIIYDGAAWNTASSSGGGASGDTLCPTFNFTDTGEARFYAYEAMTLTEQGTSGTGTIAYEKSTSAAPDTFNSTSSPITLEAGAWLKVSASAVTTIVAVALERTA